MTTNPVTPPPAAAAEAPKTFWQKAQQWFLIVCGIIIGLLGLLKLYLYAAVAGLRGGHDSHGSPRHL
jgi:H+/Cl- antiporter ClcA